VAPKALIVGTDRSLIHALEAALEGEGFDVVAAHNGVEALRAMQSERPDLVILDPMLAWLGGERVRQTPRPASRTTGPPIIVLSPKTEESERIAPLDAGGDDSVTEFFDMKELLAHVKALQQRSASVGRAGILRAGVMEMDLERWTVSVEGKAVALTAREFGLLRMLVKAKGRVLTRGVLWEIVWERGMAHGLDSRTVDVHIGRLRRKLGPAGRYIVTVRGVGYRFSIAQEWASRSSGQDA
jgi:DNA-binding response OmpR family regulator